MWKNRNFLKFFYVIRSYLLPTFAQLTIFLQCLCAIKGIHLSSFFFIKGRPLQLWLRFIRQIYLKSRNVIGGFWIYLKDKFKPNVEKLFPRQIEDRAHFISNFYEL